MLSVLELNIILTWFFGCYLSRLRKVNISR